tara:strand:- start:214 stop:624 length:411 start_codon:yes stop_codon:yes gene_type:complete
MDWVIEMLNSKSTYNQNKSGNVNNNNKESGRLYFCNGCNNVWEIKFTGGTVYYDSFPTYKLKRKYCVSCKLGVMMKRKELLEVMEECVNDLGWERDRMTKYGATKLDKLRTTIIKIKKEVKNAEKKEEHTKQLQRF